jgi:hypothetical protein
MGESLLDQPATQSCPLLNRLSRYDFIVKLPQRIWKTEQTNLLLTLQAPRDLLPLSVDEINACSLALETNLAVSNLAIEPGETLIEPFVGNESQIFLYAVSLRGTGIARGKCGLLLNISRPECRTRYGYPCSRYRLRLRRSPFWVSHLRWCVI